MKKTKGRITIKCNPPESHRGGKGKPANSKFRRKMISLRMPIWVIEKLQKNEFGSQSFAIENALIRQYNWEKPDKDY